MNGSGRDKFRSRLQVPRVGWGMTTKAATDGTILGTVWFDGVEQDARSGFRVKSDAVMWMQRRVAELARERGKTL